MNIYDSLFLSRFAPLSGPDCGTAGTTRRPVIRVMPHAFYSQGKEEWAGPDGMYKRKIFAFITNRIPILQCCSL